MKAQCMLRSTWNIKENFRLFKGGVIQSNVKALKQINTNETVIKTESDNYKFEKTVVASGAFKILNNQLGENIPLDTERGYHVHFKNKDHLIKRPVIFLIEVLG